MAISFVAAGAVVTGANPTVAVPAGVVEKDLLVIVFTGTATPATPAGWTSRAAQAATGFVTIFYKFATGTNASVTLTVAGTTTKAVMLAYRGVSATDTISTFGTATAATSLATTTLSATYANEYVISVYAGNPVVGTWTAPASTTSRVDSSPTAAVNGLLIVDELQAAAGTSTARTGTISTSHTLSAVAFSIIPSGRYWVGGAGTWTTTTTNWSFSSGGASGAPAPTANDPVTFDQAASYTVTLTGVLTCFGMTVSAGTVTFSSTGTISNSGSMSLLAGTVWSATGLVTFNSTSTGQTVTTNGVTINSPITFDGVGGVWSLGSALSTGVTLTTVLGSGTLTLNGFDLTTGSFYSSFAVARSIAFGTNNIVLSQTTAAQTVLDMATATGFTWTGTTGGFTSNASVTKTYVFGTTGGTATNAPNLSLTGSGTAIATLTTASWFNNLSFGTTAFNPGTTALNINGSLTLSSGGTFTTMTPTMLGTGTLTSNTNTTLAALTINSTVGTITLGAAFSMSATGTVTLIAGTLALGGFDLTTGIFASTGTVTRAITFGSNNIVLAHTTAATTVLSFATATGFTYTGTGGFTATAAITRTYVFGTTGGSITTAPNLSITSGAAIPTFTTASWFNNLDFTGSTATPAVSTVNVTGNLTLATGGTYTNLSITAAGTGTINSNAKTIAAFTVNNGAGTVTLAAALSVTSFTQTAGAINFATFNLTCSTTATYTAGTLSNIGTISCTTFTNSGTFAFSSGTITPSVSFVNTAGLFTYSNTAILSAVPTFTQTAGNVTLVKSLALTTSGVYTLTAGTLTLGNYTLTTGAFISTGTATRSVDFGTSSLILLTGNNITIWDGGGTGFTILGTMQVTSNYSGATGTRTINAGTGWTEANTFDVKTGSAVGISINIGATDTVLISGNVKTIDMTGMTCIFNPGTLTVYGDYTIPATGGTVSASALVTTFASTNVTARTITISRTVDYPLTIAGLGGTFNLGANLTTGATRTLTLTSGTLALSNFTLSTGLFSSTNTNVRVLNFGSTGQLSLSGNAVTIWDTTIPTNMTMSGTMKVVSTYTGAVGTRTINLGTWAEASTFDVKIGAATGISLGTATDIVIISGNVKTVDFTGMLCTVTAAAAAMLVYGDFTIPAAGGTVSASANTLASFVSTSVTARTITFGRAVDFPISFAGVGGTFNLGANLTNGTTRTVTLTGGTLTLNGFSLSSGIFASTGTSARAIAFGSNNITLTNTVAATTVLSMADATGFTLSGSGGFVSDLAVAKTFVFGTTAGSSTNSPNLALTSGAAIPTFTTGSWFNTLNFTGTTSTPAVTTIFVNTLILATGGTYTGLTPTFTSTQTWTPQFSKQLAGLGINIPSGTLTLGGSQSLIATSTTTLTAGTLNLGGFNLTTGIFSSTGTGTRAIAFGSNNIVLAHTTAATTVLSMADATNFTLTGTGGFTADLSITRTFTFGSTAGGSSTNSPNLALTSGAAIPTFTTGSWFNTLNFTGTTSTPAATSVFVNTLTLATGGTYTALTPIFTRTQTWTTQFSKQLGGIGFNLAGGTLTLGDSPSLVATGTTTLTAGTLNLGGFDLTTGIFSSSNTNTRAIVFGSNNIILATTTAATVNLAMAVTTGFTWDNTSTGGFTAAADITRTFQFGSTTAGGIEPNLTFTGSGIAIQTLTTGSWFKTLNFGTTAFAIPATSVNVNSLLLSSGGTYTGLTVTTFRDGSITSNGKTIAALTINVTLGTTNTTTLNDALSLVATGITTLTTGTLALNGFTLTTGTFVSSSAVARSVAFGSNNIVLAHTTAATTVLSMADLTNFSWTGTGGFTSGMSVTRTFTCGTTGATSTTVPNLSLTSGASIPTISTGSVFNNLTFTGSTSAPASTNISVYGNLTLASGGVYSTFTVNMIGTAGNVDSGGSTSLLGLVINNGGTTTLTSAVTLLSTGTTTLTSGNLNLNGFTLTTGTFSSSNTNTRSIAFGSNNIVLAHTTLGTTVLSMDTATNFTYTSSGTYGSGTGCFQATMSVTRTFNFGTTAGASTTNAPILYLASGASIATLSSGSWFKEVNFGTTAFTIAATTLNLVNIYNNISTSVLTNLTANMVGTGTIVMGTSIGPLIMNTASITTTVLSSSTSRCTTLTVTQGTLVLGAASSLICSSTATWNSGSLDITNGTLTCTTFTLNGPTFNFTSGTLNPTTSFVLNTGPFTYGGTATLGATTTFTQNADTVTFNKSYALNTISTYSLVAGNLILAAQVILSTGIFSSSGASTRTIGFGANVSSGSAVFNGTSQYASLSTSTYGPLDLASGAGNWTVESWFNLADTTSDHVVFWKGGATGTVNPSYSFNVATGGTGQWIVGDGLGGGTSQNLSTSFVANTWYHFALVRNGNILTAYVNGVADTPVTMSFTMGNTANGLLTIGSSAADGSTRYFAGKISNLRIVKGVAVYTGNFTVPTSPLTSTQSSGTNISAITGTQTSLLLNTVSTSFLTDSSTYAFVLTSVGSLVSSFSSPFSGLINLTHTTAATVVLSMADLTNFSYTGSGGFTVASMGNTRTITYGTSANGSATTAINLAFTTGASAIAITNGSWFKTLDFGTTTSTATGTGLNVFENLYLNGTYTAVTLSMLGTGYISGGASASLLGLTINTTGTITLAGNMTLLSTGTTTLTQGSLVLNGYTLTTGIFSSSGTGFTRSVNFGTTKIILNHTTANTIVLSMADVTGFTWTGTTGGFSSTMSATRTFTYGTSAGGSLSTAVNLAIISGASIPNISSGGWFNDLDFTGSACVPAATTLNIAGDVTLASGGTFTAMALTMLSTSTITPAGKTVGAFVVNTPDTITLAAAFGSTTYTQTAGIMNFAGFNMTCSSTVTYDGGTFSNIGTLTCTTFTKNIALSLTSGAINPSVSFVQAAGAFTLSNTATVTTALFTHSVGDVTFNNNQSMAVTGTYNLASGNLILADGVTLNTGIFTSNNTATRSIAFGSTTAGNINLTHTTALTTVLQMADLTGFSDSGPGGFTVAAMGNTRTLTYGTTGGTTSNAANLTFTTGASIATITSGSWFNNLNFGTTTFNPGTTTLNIVNSLTLSATGAYLTLTPVPQANVTYTFNSASFGPLAINTTFTVTLGSAASCTTFTMTAGTLNFASYNLTCSSTAAFNGGTFSNIGTLACTTFTNNSTLSLSSGVINPTVSFVQASGSFTIGGTATIGSTPLFTHTAGTVTFNTTQSIATTGTYTFTAGTLTLADGVTLNTGIFSSSNVNARSIAFGSTTAGNINLTHTTATTVVLSMADVTNFTYTGPGGFTVADMGNTRTFTFGTTGGSTITAANLTFTTGAFVATLTTASWFKNLNFGTTAFNPGTTALNIVGNLTLSSGGVYTTTTINALASGTYTFNGASLGPFIVNGSGITITLGSAGASTTLAVTLGTLNFASFNFTCSSTATYNGGTLSNIGTLACTIFTINGPSFNFTSGTINPSTGFTLTSGSFTLDGTATIGLFTGTFTHTAGTVTFNKTYAFSTTTTYLLTAGTLNIASGFTMYVGILSSANTNTRSIAFGTSSAGYVNLTGTGTILSMATATGFTWTGPGGFQTDNANYNISTLSFGNTAGGSTTTAPNLSFTAGGGAGGTLVQTITTGSWFNNLDFGTTAFNPGTTALNINGSLTLSSAGAYSALTPTMLGTGTITSNTNTTLFALTINSTSGTTTLGDALSLIATGTTTLTSGTLALNGFNLSTGIFSSSSATTRAISFGTGNINLTHTTAATTVLSMAIVTGFTYTGTGGFTVADMSNTRTFTFGTTGGSITNAPNLTFTTGASVATLTTASWFKTLSFGTTAFNPGTTALNLASGLTLSSGGAFTTLTPTMLGTGTITSNSNTTLVALIINSTSGTTSLGAAFSMAATGTVTLTSGALALNGFDLTTGIFSSSGATTRSIAFGTNNIVLAHTTAATTVLSMADVTNFTYTGTGGFTANASITRTYVFGTTSGSTTNSPTLAITTGAAVPSITTGSWFNLLNFTGTTSTPAATTVNLNALTLAVGGTFTNLSATMVGTGTITSNGKTLSALTVNAPGLTVTTADALSITNTLTLTAGALVAPYSITSGTFFSAGPYAKSITGSTTTYTITGAGATAWSFASTGSVLFTGTQYLSIPDASSLRFGTSPFTVEGWIYRTSTAFGYVVTKVPVGLSTGWTIACSFLTGAISFKAAGGSVSLDGATSVPINTWHHFAVVREGTGTNQTKIYLDGQLDATGTCSTDFTNTDIVRIGASSSVGSSYFIGNITNNRIVNGVAVYTGNFTPPTAPLLPTQSSGANISAITGTQTSFLLSTPFNSFLTDYSTNAYTVTNVGTATASALSPFAATSPGITFTNFTLSMTAATAKTFAGGGATYPTLNQGGAGALTISDNNSFADLTATTRPSTITFTASSTQTFTAFTLSGILGSLVTINSSTPGTRAILSKSSGTVSVNYLSIQDSNATGGAGWYAGTTSTNVSNNLGWIFTAPPTPGAAYAGNFFAFF